MPEVNNNKFKIFSWAIGIIISIFIIFSGWIFAGMERINSRIDGHDSDIMESKIYLSAIQTDLKWIKEALNQIKDSGKLNNESFVKDGETDITE